LVSCANFEHIAFPLSDNSLAITKNGLQKLAAPPSPDLSKIKSDKKITDEEVLKILEQPLAKETKAKSKKKKKPAKKAAAAADDDEESSDEE
jgi:hypothetical protein